MPTEHAPQFPNPALAPRLVLYPLAAGGVAIDWRVDPILIQQARDAFAAQHAVPKLYLRRLDADGACLAQTELTGLDSRPNGRALFEQPLTGALLAELGLEGQPGGGWLLLARSNQLDAVADRLAESPAPPMAARSSQLDAVPATAQRARSHDPGLSSHPSAIPSASPAPSSSSSTESRARRPAPARPTRHPDPSLAALAERPELGAAPFPVVSSAATRRSSDPGTTREPLGAEGCAALEIGSAQTSAQADLAQRAADSPSALASNSARWPDARAVPAHGPWEPTRNNGQDESRWSSRVSRGSGPIRAYPGAAEMRVQGELHVFGQAPPGSVLDLGGHPLRVGSGGRFSFRVALDDPVLLAALLERLPRLPVAERDPSSSS